MKKQEHIAAELVFLDEKALEFGRSEGGFLSLRLGKREFSRVHVYRSFPLSLSDSFVSVRDHEDKEIGIIRSLKLLSRSSRVAVEEELAARYFTPTIEKIVTLKSEFGYVYWDVETSAGRCRITTEVGQNAILSLEGKRIIISDVDGNRYEMEDYGAVSPAHLRIIETLI